MRPTLSRSTSPPRTYAPSEPGWLTVIRLSDDMSPTRYMRSSRPRRRQTAGRRRWILTRCRIGLSPFVDKGGGCSRDRAEQEEEI